MNMTMFFKDKLNISQEQLNDAFIQSLLDRIALHDLDAMSDLAFIYLYGYRGNNAVGDKEHTYGHLSYDIKPNKNKGIYWIFQASLMGHKCPSLELAKVFAGKSKLLSVDEIKSYLNENTLSGTILHYEGDLREDLKSAEGIKKQQTYFLQKAAFDQGSNTAKQIIAEGGIKATTLEPSSYGYIVENDEKPTSTVYRAKK